MRQTAFFRLTLRDFLWLAVVLGLVLMLYFQQSRHDAEVQALHRGTQRMTLGLRRQVSKLTLEAARLQVMLIDQETFILRAW